jgi:hypothetical protein
MIRIKLFTLLAGLLISLGSQAQLKGFGIGPYIETAWATAGFDDTHNKGIGVGIGADLNLPARFGLTASTGYMHITGKTLVTNQGNEKAKAINALPVRVGLKYRLPAVYIKLESGIAKLTDGRPAPIIIAPGVGVRLLGLDVQGKFEAWVKEDTWSFWGIKVGYQF